LANLIQALRECRRPLLDIINACSDVHHLDEVAKLLWKGNCERQINNSGATHLSSREAAS
jgi:hypothetical protein